MYLSDRDWTGELPRDSQQAESNLDRLLDV